MREKRMSQHVRKSVNLVDSVLKWESNGSIVVVHMQDHLSLYYSSVCVLLLVHPPGLHTFP